MCSRRRVWSAERVFPERGRPPPHLTHKYSRESPSPVGSSFSTTTIIIISVVSIVVSTTNMDDPSRPLSTIVNPSNTVATMWVGTDVNSSSEHGATGRNPEEDNNDDEPFSSPRVIEIRRPIGSIPSITHIRRLPFPFPLPSISNLVLLQDKVHLLKAFSSPSNKPMDSILEIGINVSYRTKLQKILFHLLITTHLGCRPHFDCDGRTRRRHFQRTMTTVQSWYTDIRLETIPTSFETIGTIGYNILLLG